MITTGIKDTLPPYLVMGAQPSEGKNAPSAYVSGIIE